MEFKHKDITNSILKAFFSVYNQLGYGFIERIYQNSMFIELQGSNLVVVQQAPIEVYYRGVQVGRFAADLLVADSVIVELKAVKALAEEHEAQLLNYLKATRYEVGLLLNFGPKAEFRRKAFDNARKGTLEWTQHLAAK